MLSTQRGPFLLPETCSPTPSTATATWLGKWLRKRRIVSGNPRCQKPFFLKEIPIQDVAIQDFTCDGEEAGGRAGLGKEARREGRCEQVRTPEIRVSSALGGQPELRRALQACFLAHTAPSCKLKTVSSF